MYITLHWVTTKKMKCTVIRVKLKILTNTHNIIIITKMCRGMNWLKNLVSSLGIRLNTPCQQEISLWTSSDLLPWNIKLSWRKPTIPLPVLSLRLTWQTVLSMRFLPLQLVQQHQLTCLRAHLQKNNTVNVGMNVVNKHFYYKVSNPCDIRTTSY